MMSVRPAAARGHSTFDWLDSRHTFSFGEYQDPAHMGFRALRVINEDRVVPGAGFGTHPHRDMEIITWVLGGALEHRDSLGTGSVIRPGDVQRMSAGSGIQHSEFNASADEAVHFLQIWIVPERTGSEPGYEQRRVEFGAGDGLRLLASRDGRAGSVTVHQTVDLYAGRLAAGATAAHTLADGRHAWLQVARGAVTANGQALAAGDGAALSGVERVELRAAATTEVLLFDLA